MPHILIIGQKFSSLTEYLANHGHTYTFLQDRVKTKFPDKKFKHRVLADFSNKERLLAAVDQLKQPIDAVLTTYENYVLPCAWVAEHLHLPGMPIESAEACTDKSLMRSLFSKAPEKISPDFSVVQSEPELQAFAKQHDFPLILKPANLAKSLLVTKNDSMEELLTNYRKSAGLLHGTYRKYAPNRTPKMIVEEFLKGSIHSVDAFVDREGNPHILAQIVDYQTGYDIGFEDNFHYSRLLPSRLSVQDQAALLHCAEVGIRALGMKSSPAHVEIIMTKDGPRIVEIGARNGGYRERMHKLANNIDITGAALALALGEQPIIAASKSDPCAVLELFPKTPGKFEAIENTDDLNKLASLAYLSVKAVRGQYAGKASEGYKMCAVIVLSNSNVQLFNRDLAFINQRVVVKTSH